jgi:hypothetical protein
MMKIRLLAALAGTTAILAFCTIANAAVVFSDSFNDYTPALNWNPPANWTVLPNGDGGTVDLIGVGTAWDFYSGQNGYYVDLGGSSGAFGTLETSSSFGAGTYTLTFDLGGNDRSYPSNTTTISLGSWSTQITLASSDPYALHSYTFTTSTAGQLSFLDSGGNPNVGSILDNVTLSSGVPELSTWGMMVVGFAGLGFAGYRQTKRKESVAFSAA